MKKNYNLLINIKCRYNGIYTCLFFNFSLFLKLQLKTFLKNDIILNKYVKIGYSHILNLK